MTKTNSIKGNISIHTQNIFPIIKQWLYSDREVFLRELISNAFDAIKKRHQITKKNPSLEPADKGLINVIINEKEKTLTISDNGLGMTAEEIEKYITQIAFSGAEDFLKTHTDDKNKEDIIGHFGLGFYSSFMVADKVEIYSKSYQKETLAAHWLCEGSTSFELSETKKENIGTSIVLHLNKDSHDFLKEETTRQLIKKYANFLPVEIQLNGKSANDQNPLWVRSPQELKKEDYETFFQTLYPMQPKPLFWIHLNVDYPFRLQGILFFPKIQHELDSHKGKIKLFCQQVFVTDSASEVIPEFLTLLQGCIDCPDIPLNVSRSMLQNDPYVQKISNHIVKKVASKLNTLYKNDLDAFKTYWEDIHLFIKYGMMNHPDFYEKVKDIVLYKNTNNSLTTLNTYLEKQDKEKTIIEDKDNKEDKEKRKTVVYSTNKASQGNYIQALQKENIEVLLLDTLIDSHFIQFLESKKTDVSFKSVDASAEEFLMNEDNKSKLTDSKGTPLETDSISPIFKPLLTKAGLKIESKSFRSSEIPAIISQPEHVRRFKEMSKMMPDQQALPDTFNEHTLILNTENPIVKNIVTKYKKSPSSPTIKLLCEHIYDIAKLGHEPLNSDQMQAFISRSTQLLEAASI